MSDTMRVIVAHNFYQQSGGEDQVFADEVRLLREHGHEVHLFTKHNDALTAQGRLAQLGAAIWNRQSARELGGLVRSTGAQVVHFHNTFPLMSPAAYYAAHRHGAAVVQTLHNYRLICAGALLYRDGAVCEDCVGRRLTLSPVTRACYRGSASASAATVAMTSIHAAARTWQREVDLFLALTEFGREKFIRGGLPTDRVRVKPNFLAADPGPGRGDGGYALFVGRLSEEKGLRVLLDAWPMLGESVRLKIVGDGPLMDLVRSRAASNPTIDVLGRRTPAEVLALMGDASCLVFPSQWYEGQPRTVIESLACGTPVIASDLGAMHEMLGRLDRGLLFEPGDPGSLARAVNGFFARRDHAVLRDDARSEFLNRYTATANHAQLIASYGRAYDRYTRSKQINLTRL